jgi:hypothetical protein
MPVNGLIAKLDAALVQVNRGNNRPAYNQLQAYGNQVAAAERSGNLSKADATKLYGEVGAISARLALKRR